MASASLAWRSTMRRAKLVLWTSLVCYIIYIMVRIKIGG